MRKKNTPAIDSALAPKGGFTRDGQPLSCNRAPRSDLAPWIARLYVTDVQAPPGYRLECGLFNDAAAIRFQLHGEWHAETLSGPMQHGRAALYFGPQSRLMPVAVTGSFCSIGISLRPGACHVLRGPKVCEWVDRICQLEQFGMELASALQRFDPEMSPEEQIVAMEGIVAAMVERVGGRLPDPETARFEAAAFTDPTIAVADFARDCSIELRRLERIVRRDFGLPPKQVLRRARALDMASHLRGVADSAEAEALMLRYYDQSHLIREFTALFGMTPNQFVARPLPILTLALESRQARRLEAIDRIAPGAMRPWQ